MPFKNYADLHYSDELKKCKTCGFSVLFRCPQGNCMECCIGATAAASEGS